MKIMKKKGSRIVFNSQEEYDMHECVSKFVRNILINKESKYYTDFFSELVESDTFNIDKIIDNCYRDLVKDVDPGDLINVSFITYSNIIQRNLKKLQFKVLVNEHWNVLASHYKIVPTLIKLDNEALGTVKTDIIELYDEDMDFVTDVNHLNWGISHKSVRRLFNEAGLKEVKKEEK